MTELVRTLTIDKNGQPTHVYRRPDGAGVPTPQDRVQERRTASGHPPYSPHQIHNIDFADDVQLRNGSFAGESGGIYAARLHEDGVVELLGFNTKDNIDITRDDIEGIKQLRAGYEQYTRASLAERVEVSLSSGGSITLVPGGDLLVVSATEAESEFSGYDGDKLVKTLIDMLDN